MSDFSNNPYFAMKNVEKVPEVVPAGSPVMPISTDTPQLIRTRESGDKVFYVKDGIARWVSSLEALTAMNGGLGDVVMVKRDVFRTLKMAERITIDNANQFKLVKKEQPKEQPKEEIALKVYEEDTTAPKLEPVKGLTSIIMPVYWIHYPSWHFTGNAIGSIREHTDKLKTPYEIILVINGNKEATIKMEDLKLTYADKVITNDENFGYAKAVNQGIRISQGEYIAVINNDVQVFEHWLEDMQEALKHAALVMATPMYGMPFARAVEAKMLRDITLEKTIEQTFSDFTDFSCAITTKKLFTELGVFNEEFFMYCEDLDLIRRIQKDGRKAVSTKRVNTHHITSATASGVADTSDIMNESKAKLKEIWGF